MAKIHPITLLIISFIIVNAALLVAGQPMLLIEGIITPEIKDFSLKLISGAGMVVMLLSYVSHYPSSNSKAT